MADSHLQVNHDGSTGTRKTTLWPTSKSEQEIVIKSIFEQNNWIVGSIKNISGSHWKINVSCLTDELNINLYISSIRDESRQPDEFKMQLGNSYPDGNEEGWLTLVLGIYVIDNDSKPVEYILSGYDIERYDFSSNPSIRGTRTYGLQRAKLLGMYTTERSVLFRPEFLYYYIESQKSKSFVNTSTTPVLDTSVLISTYNLYLTALRTKPFLLLAGISGTGKSQKVQELAFMSCPKGDLRTDNNTTPGNYCLIEVKPNWHDSTELLGYYSALSGRYELTDFIRFAYKAILNPTVPFFLCLDEMNLSPVEQYFAEFLSVLETRKKTSDGIETQPLLTMDKFSNCELQKMVLVKENGNIINGETQYKMELLYSEKDAEIILYFLDGAVGDGNDGRHHCRGNIGHIHAALDGGLCRGSGHKAVGGSLCLGLRLAGFFGSCFGCRFFSLRLRLQAAGRIARRVVDSEESAGGHAAEKHGA